MSKSKVTSPLRDIVLPIVSGLAAGAAVVGGAVWIAPHLQKLLGATPYIAIKPYLRPTEEKSLQPVFDDMRDMPHPTAEKAAYEEFIRLRHERIYRPQALTDENNVHKLTEEQKELLRKKAQFVKSVEEHYGQQLEDADIHKTEEETRKLLHERLK